VSPVVDGYELHSASIYTGRGGNCMDELLEKRMASVGMSPINLWIDTPLMRQKYPLFVAKESFRRMHTKDVIRNIKESFSFIPYKPLPFHQRKEYYDAVLTFPPPFELPDGDCPFPWMPLTAPV
jgi:hypothetical protein